MSKKIILLVGIWILTFIFVTGISYAQSGWIQPELNGNMGYSLSVTDSAILAATQQVLIQQLITECPGFQKVQQVNLFTIL